MGRNFQKSAFVSPYGQKLSRLNSCDYISLRRVRNPLGCFISSPVCVYRLMQGPRDLGEVIWELKIPAAVKKTDVGKVNYYLPKIATWQNIICLMKTTWRNNICHIITTWRNNICHIITTWRNTCNSLYLPQCRSCRWWPWREGRGSWWCRRR